MLFSLGVLVLLLAVAFRQATLGLFNALIMMVLTICCAAAAFGTYEWVAINWIAPLEWQPDCAAAIALIATFTVPLLILRIVADQLIRRSSLLPSWLDRVGGGICGFVTALILIGVMAIGVQMIPFDNGSILGYSHIPVYSRTAQDDGSTRTPPAVGTEPKESNLCLGLRPDRFAAAMASSLSDGLFSGKRSLVADYPDLVKATSWLNAAPIGASRYAPPKSVRFEEAERVPSVFAHQQPQGESVGSFDKIDPKRGQYFQKIRVSFTGKARSKVNKSHAFTLRQFRLVGRRPGGDGYEQVHPIAVPLQLNKVEEASAEALTRPNRYIVAGGQQWPVTDEPITPSSIQQDGKTKLVADLIFELPKDFEPVFLEFKRGARMSISFDSDKQARRSRSRRSAPSTGGERNVAENAAADNVAASVSSGQTSSSRQPGRTRRYASREGQSRFSDEMPMALRSYRKLKSAETRRAALVDGHLVGYVDEQASGHNREINRFRVPSDKQLLQLNADFLETRSGLGRALSTAVGVVQNYFVEDTRGRQFKVVGKYAVADVEGRRVVEVQYFSSPTGTMGGLGAFDRIDEDRDFKGDYQFILLFLVDPGSHITRFSTGGSATQAEDLTTENLIAPP